jgi:hypothetical protein
VPAGWTASGINHDGVFDAVGGKVKWGLFSDGAPRLLSYRVTPPSAANGVAAFSGVMSCDGSSAQAGGIRQLREGCRLDLASSAQGRLRLAGRAGARCVVETSNDLRTWTPLTTVTAAPGGVEFNDPEQTNAGRRFYRARVVE